MPSTPKTTTRSLTDIETQRARAQDAIGACMEKHYLFTIARGLDSKIESLNARFLTTAKVALQTISPQAAETHGPARLISDNEAGELARAIAVRAALSGPELDEARATIQPLLDELESLDAEEIELRLETNAKRIALEEQLEAAKQKAERDPEILKLKSQLDELS